MTELPALDEERWARMSWQARQRWLRAATALRRQLQADLDARLATERGLADRRWLVNGDTLTAAQAILDAIGPDPQGHAHLEAAEAERHWGGRR